MTPYYIVSSTSRRSMNPTFGALGGTKYSYPKAPCRTRSGSSWRLRRRNQEPGTQNQEPEPKNQEPRTKNQKTKNQQHRTRN